MRSTEGCTLVLFTHVLGWSVENTYEFLDQVIAELKDHQQQFYHTMCTRLPPRRRYTC